MKIFIICCLLFIHVNMCIRGFGFGDGFPPESVSGSGSGFDFGFWFWVHGDSTRSEPDPLPSLPVRGDECRLDLVFYFQGDQMIA